MSRIRSYSLAEVAEMVLPAEWTDGERWLARRIAAGKIPGYRLNRCTFRMTEEQLQEFVATYSPRSQRPEPPAREPAPPISVVDGLSARSRQRVRSVS